MVGYCHPAEDEAHWGILTLGRPVEAVLVLKRAVEEPPFQMLKMTARLGLRLLEPHKASAIPASFQAFLRQTLPVQVACPLMNSDAEKPR